MGGRVEGSGLVRRGGSVVMGVCSGEHLVGVVFNVVEDSWAGSDRGHRGGDIRWKSRRVRTFGRASLTREKERQGTGDG